LLRFFFLFKSYLCEQYGQVNLIVYIIYYRFG